MYYSSDPRSSRLRARGHSEHHLPKGTVGGGRARADGRHRGAPRCRYRALAAPAGGLGCKKTASLAAAGPVPTDRGALPYLRQEGTHRSSIGMSSGHDTVPHLQQKSYCRTALGNATGAYKEELMSCTCTIQIHKKN